MLISEILTQYDYSIKWRITYKCNYQCEYCIQRKNHCLENHRETDYDKLEVARKVADLIRPKTIIELIGGDISVVKEIPEISKMFKEKGAFVKATTNLSQPWEFYKDFSWVRGSFHASQCDMEEFKTKLLKLRESGVQVSTEVVFSGESKPEDEEKKQKFWMWAEQEGIPITIDLDRWHPTYKTVTQKQIKTQSYYYFNGERITRSTLLSESGFYETFGKKCYRGVNTMYISLGQVSVCPTHKNQGFQWSDTPDICHYRKCRDILCIPVKLD